jgi:hypothetical protein
LGADIAAPARIPFPAHRHYARLRDELLNGEIFYTLREAQIVITPQSDTSHQHQRCLSLHSPRGRLRYADRLATLAQRPTLN